MLYAAPITAMLLFALQSIRAKSLIAAALWLAGTSATASLTFFLLGAKQVAVIELSVGAGLVTVLFVFAINLAGQGILDLRSLVPRPLAILTVALSTLLLGRLLLRLQPKATIPSEPPLAALLWGQRGLDVLVQIVLIFAGVLGLLGLLAEAKAPLDHPVAEEVAAERQRALSALEKVSYEVEEEVTA